MKKNIIKKIAAALLIIATLFTLCSCSPGKASIKKDIELIYTGANGHAKATINADYAALSKSINEKKATKYYVNLTKDSFGGILTAAALSDINDPDRLFSAFFRLTTAESYNALRNGDTAVVNVEVSEYMSVLGQTLKDVIKGTGMNVPETIEYKVSGLEEAKELDVFGNISKIVKFEGANGHAQAYIDIDEDYNVTDGAAVFTRTDSEKSVEISVGDNEICSATFSVEENENLDKGDTVTVSLANIDSVEDALMEYGYVLKSETATATVPDMGDAKEYDILSIATECLHFKGANGYGSAYIEIPKGAEFSLGDVYFKTNSSTSFSAIYNNAEMGVLTIEVTAEDNLKANDTVKLTLSGYAIGNLEDEGVYAKTKTMDVKVPDLGEFINGYGELTAADIEFIKNTALKAASEKEGKDVKLEAVYFGRIKENAAHNYKAKGFVSVIYSYSDFFGTEYAGVDYYDISKNPDGDLNLETNKFFGGWAWNYNGPESFNQNYTYEKIG